MSQSAVRGRKRLTIATLLAALASVVVVASDSVAAVYYCNGRVATIVGTDGDDELFGSDSADVIVGRGGADNIEGRGGNDTICGGDGADGLNGGVGDDYIDGGIGADSLWGGDGRDEMYGSSGNDDMFGGGGVDTLRGQGDRDYMRGGAGYDAMDGGGADDALYPDADSANMDGGDGSDICVDGAGTSRNCEAYADGSGPCPPGFASMVGTYRPTRLSIVNNCASITGTVVSGSVFEAGDGDLHFKVNVNGTTWVVEYMPRDKGNYTKPSGGQTIALTGVKANDKWHNDHLEMHPVFSAKIGSNATQFSGPRYAGSPYMLNPSGGGRRFCWRADGSRCVGWNGQIM